ncbi:MAG TPA: hypothetical protein PLK12_03995 [Prolixibacteraceae bacterium]|nr:hypothetical protein [Prolixibacteraceae bacterium]
MKKVLFLALSFSLFTATSLFANVDQESDFDESEIYAAFEPVSDIGERILTEEGLTYSTLFPENNALVENASAVASAGLNASQQSPPVLNAFLWGCVAGVTGIVLVAVTTGNDEAQIKSALIGCVVQSVSISVVYSVASFVFYYALDLY